MPFPKSERIIFAENPLEEVVCQVRFPPILTIESDVPSAFQESVRAKYPLYGKQSMMAMPYGPQLMPPIVPYPAVHRFSSNDNSWFVSLAADFVALTTKRYVQWEDFYERFEEILDIFRNRYDPTFYTRLGLRYKNVISRSRLALSDKRWSELLLPSIAGELCWEAFEESEYEAAFRQIVLKIGNTETESAKVVINHGLALAPDHELCYVIDSDFFTEERIETNAIREKLSYFNDESGRLFRWCITDRLRTALERKRS